MLTQDRTHVQKSFDSNTVYNFPDLKTIQMFINNRIDLKIVVYSDSEILHTHIETEKERQRKGERKWGSGGEQLREIQNTLILKHTTEQKKTGSKSYIHTIWFHLYKMKNQANLNYIVKGFVLKTSGETLKI